MLQQRVAPRCSSYAETRACARACESSTMLMKPCRCEAERSYAACKLRVLWTTTGVPCNARTITRTQSRSHLVFVVGEARVEPAATASLQPGWLQNCTLHCNTVG